MKHVMLSYQWDIQDLVKKVYDGLRAYGIRVWMDIHGGIRGDINGSMAKGVDGAAILCCFMSTKYSESKNCKKELSYADGKTGCEEVIIVPVMCEKGFKAKGWLGIITAGLLWIDFRDEANFENSVKSLAQEIMHAVGDSSDITLAPDEKQEAASKSVVKPTAEVKKNPGRAFRHKIAGKFLAETGQVKFHPASGNRSTLDLRDTPEDTSYWVEERKIDDKEITFYKNYATNGYLGYDPNGDYIYTKGQRYGAEEWKIVADETSHDGKRAVVLFANYGKKYLAIRNGKLTGVNSKNDDCIWILE
ncbi:predicted protein [Nematostella vectensis]|uniref:TIR domain-containing protein n=1 Tax=Nematostella vectensis TaxID=45351 RepID=A7SAI7_NEMVE|nr:predicted protein [Nematostella vectensis]|eukprot:XP_001631379.1 predicted protein [Nematostella vectensis]